MRMWPCGLRGAAGDLRARPLKGGTSAPWVWRRSASCRCGRRAARIAAGMWGGGWRWWWWRWRWWGLSCGPCCGGPCGPRCGNPCGSSAARRPPPDRASCHAGPRSRVDRRLTRDARRDARGTRVRCARPTSDTRPPSAAQPTSWRHSAVGGAAFARSPPTAAPSRRAEPRPPGRHRRAGAAAARWRGGSRGRGSDDGRGPRGGRRAPGDAALGRCRRLRAKCRGRLRRHSAAGRPVTGRLRLAVDKIALGVLTRRMRQPPLRARHPAGARRQPCPERERDRALPGGAGAPGRGER
jgi:hypothetical protein